MPVHGIVQDFSTEDLQDIFQSLVETDLISKADGQYPTYFVTDQGKNFLQQKAKIQLPKPQEKFVPLEKKQTLEYNQILFEQLRHLRRKLADQKQVAPFMIFGDQSLQEMAYYFPINLEEFAKIMGVGSRKLEEFGQVFVRLIKKEVKTNLLKPISISSRFQRSR